MTTNYKDLMVRLDTATRILKKKIYELQENYRLKGPKGFPDAYRNVFPFLHPTTVKLTDVNNQGSGRNDFNSRGNNAGDGIREVSNVEAKNVEVASDPERIIYQYVDESPVFPGEMPELVKYLREHIVYPERAKEEGVGGKVFLRFVISDKGEVSDVKVQKGIPNCPECDREAVRVIKGMPKWIPGKMGGKPVDSYFSLPILFKPIR